MKFLVTGSSGYIGGYLVDELRGNGHVVVKTTRECALPLSSAVFFDLENPSSPPVLPNDISAVIHLAAITSAADDSGQKEIAATCALLAEAARIGARFIFVSSQTAAPDAPTPYGRVKWALERKVLEAEGIVVRIGQVYGGQEKGLFGLLCRVVRRSPVLPLFLPAPFVQPVHVKDCAAGIVALAEKEGVRSSIYRLSCPHPVSFSLFLRTIATCRVRRFRVFIPTPVLLVRLARQVFGASVSEKIGVNRLLSLYALPRMDSADDLRLVGLRLRPLRAGMHRSGNIRAELIEEGAAIMRYLLKKWPCPELVRRYVRMVEAVRGGAPLYLPFVNRCLPVLLSLPDSKRPVSGTWLEEFAWRMDAAAIIAEASKQGGVRYIGTLDGRRRWKAIAAVVCAAGAGGFWKGISLFVPRSWLAASGEWSDG